MTFPIPTEPPAEVTFITVDNAPTATITFHSITMAALRDCYDAAFGALATAIGSGDVAPNGPALGIYHGDPSATFDLEVGFPLAAALEHDVTVDGFTVRAGTNLAGRWATLGYVGSYDRLPATWAALTQVVAERGYRLGPVSVEAYVSDPSSTPPEELRTDVFAAVK